MCHLGDVLRMYTLAGMDLALVGKMGLVCMVLQMSMRERQNLKNCTQPKDARLVDESLCAIYTKTWVIEGLKFGT